MLLVSFNGICGQICWGSTHWNKNEYIPEKDTLTYCSHTNTGRLVLKNTVYSALASKLNMDLINKGSYGMFIACEV